MKNILWVIVLSFFISNAGFSQTDAVGSIPEHRWEIGLAYNSVEAQMTQELFDTWVAPTSNYYGFYGTKKNGSFSVGSTLKYHLKSEWTARVEFDFTRINLSSRYDGFGDTLTQGQGHILGTADVTSQQNIHQNIYRFAPGLEYNIIKKEKVSLYTGAYCSFQIFDKMYWYDSITSSPGRATVYESNTVGGVAIGIGALVGTQYFIRPQISVGGEIAYAISYYNLGGEQTGTFTNYYNTGLIETQNWTIHDNASSGIQFMKLVPSFRLSLHF